MTEYQPEVDLEIESRIEQIKFEREQFKSALKTLVNLFDQFEEGDATYENAYYSFYKGEYNTWLKAKDLLKDDSI